MIFAGIVLILHTIIQIIVELKFYQNEEQAFRCFCNDGVRKLAFGCFV